MSTQHTARQAKLNRRQMDEQYKEQHAARLSARNLEDELITAEHRIAKLETELAAAQAELQATKQELTAALNRNAKLETELLQSEKLSTQRHSFMMDAWRRFEEITAAHSKLSKVIRLALSPEQYHYYREMIDE
jgi:septal ring factor EnvC (AmiA/AmiB activator)